MNSNTEGYCKRNTYDVCKVILGIYKNRGFGFGGGYAMLSLIQDEVVNKHQWLSKQEFTDLVAISQMTPGPIGINSATYVGYKSIEAAGYPPVVSLLGAIISTFALCLPSFLMISIISYFFIRFRQSRYFSSAMYGIKPLSIALIGLAALSLTNRENFIDGYSVILFVLTLVCAIRFKVHPILMLLGAAVIGLVIY